MSAASLTTELPEPLARHSLRAATGSVARSYSVIHADPPWRYDDKLGNSPAWGAMKYPTMSVDELCALPVKKHAAKDCALLMWATWPLLPEALRVIEAWGFKYRTCAFVWVKQNPNADNGWLIRQDLKDALDGYSGLGKWVNGNTEICLLAKRGCPKRQAKNVKQLVIAPRSRHSAKPPEVRDRLTCATRRRKNFMNRFHDQELEDFAEASDGGLRTTALVADLERRFGEDNGGSEVFDLIDATTISCRYADLCIKRDSHGWRYGPCPEAYATPSECYANHRENLVRFHSANDQHQATASK